MTIKVKSQKREIEKITEWCQKIDQDKKKLLDSK